MRRGSRKQTVGRSGKAQRRAADRPEGVAVGQTAPKRKRAEEKAQPRACLPRAAGARGTAAASALIGAVLMVAGIRRGQMNEA